MIVDKIDHTFCEKGYKKKLDSVIIEMKKVIKEKKILKRIYIETIDVKNIKMSDIRTNQHRYIWERYRKKVHQYLLGICQKA